MSDSAAGSHPEPRHTAPMSVVVGALGGLQNAILPAVAAAFGTGISGIGLFIGLGVGAAIAVLSAGVAYLRWSRLTYTIGEADIRVESGVLSRSARSVPFERIQDVSLEQKLLPRLFGLVAVKFETGAGGGEDLSLTYLTEDHGEELRQVVRDRRDGADQSDAAAIGEGVSGALADDRGDRLFTMGPARLFTFGLFEFSLAVFAVLAGLLQYADNFLDIEIWDMKLWRNVIEDQSGKISQIGAVSQAFGAAAALLGVILIGSLTGMVRVFSREWGFLLERTARGFRRRRGLFTRTDVVMPAHRVQGVKIATGFLRYRFGWHSLSFVSLAQDQGAASHVVAPFARLEEIAPIVNAAGFDLPGTDADWRRASENYLIDSVFFDALFVALGAAAAFIATTFFAPEWRDLATGILLVLAGITAIANALAWQYQRHALDHVQIMATSGVLSPRSRIATRLKLHSVEISQGPIARLRGYATVHLGQAGGEFSIPGVPVDRAREVRRKVLETIAETDFSQLESQTAG
ncbi:PH domain-containing protein [Qipengyuania sp. ASV99]|uniref:PH domain-containing protein n=1 Tax=Qipengyuania sp. ASV99 TaxID=3399681 RepID=UPI003A4C7AF4